MSTFLKLGELLFDLSFMDQAMWDANFPKGEWCDVVDSLYWKFY